MLRSLSFHAIAASALLLATVPGLARADDDPIHHVSSEVCSNCHQEIYRQWKGSMHANSTAINDPIHGVFYEMVAGSPTEEGVLHKASGKYPICLQCHAPNAALDQSTKLDAKVAYNEGVNCVACHTLKHYKGIDGEDGKLRLGMQAYERSDKLQAPLGIKDGVAQLAAAGDDLFGGAGLGADSDQKPNPHLGEPIVFGGQTIPALPMEANPRLVKSSDACMGCHDQRDNPHGVPLCQTGNEYQESLSQVNCLSCHMPIANGIADHSMGGGHSPAMLKRAVIFDVNAVKDGDTLKTTVYLKNQLPHAMPTGAPFRNLFIKLTAYDDQGEAIWENAEGHPAESDPQAYLSYALIDNEGMPAPPPAATQAGDDTRLRPHEERELVYEIPAEGVALVRGELFYNLLWPNLVKRFDHLPSDLTAPVLIAEYEQRLVELD
ncbi:MAG: cytochrome c family protein [Halochromatium sp.]|uniref:cytochrome c family protein n=1 Tax=Halochromatium sp. TaxID=2049430 RepID=UPI00397C6056